MVLVVVVVGCCCWVLFVGWCSLGGICWVVFVGGVCWVVFVGWYWLLMVAAVAAVAVAVVVFDAFFYCVYGRIMCEVVQALYTVYKSNGPVPVH